MRCLLMLVDGTTTVRTLELLQSHGGVLNVETPGQGVNLVLVCTDTDTNEGPILDLTNEMRVTSRSRSNDIIVEKYVSVMTILIWTMTNYVELTTVVADSSDGIRGWSATNLTLFSSGGYA